MSYLLLAVTALVFAFLWWFTAIRLVDTRFEVVRLRNAIREHRAQKADDRCWLDDVELYSALCDGQMPDPRVGDKAAMLANCSRFIERRCIGGKWPTYVELEMALRTLIEEIDRWEASVVKIVPSFTRARKWESLEAARGLVRR